MKRKKKLKKKTSTLGGIGKLATITSESIGSAYDSFKKRQYYDEVS